MSDRPAMNENEREARRQLVELVRRLLRGDLSFLEGTEEVRHLRHEIGGILERDVDFNVFEGISSEIDHLPLKKYQPLWDNEALERLAPEFRRAEEWASEFGQEACRRLLSRFKQDD